MKWLFASLLGIAAPAYAGTDGGLFGITAETNAYALTTCKPAKREFYYDCQIPAAAEFFTHAVINYEPDEGVCGMRLSVELDKAAAKQRVEDLTRLLDTAFGRDRAVRTRLSRLVADRPNDWPTQLTMGVSLDTPDNAWRIEDNAKLRKLWEASVQVTRQPDEKVRVQLDAYFHPNRSCTKPPLPTRYTIRELAPVAPK